MHEAQADKDYNCLFIKLEGFLSDEELRDAANEWIEKATVLSPGFGIINDITNFKTATQSGAQCIRDGQIELDKLGAAFVIRIVGETLLGAMQFKRTQQEAQAMYKHYEVSSKQEALELLKELSS